MNIEIQYYNIMLNLPIIVIATIIVYTNVGPPYVWNVTVSRSINSTFLISWSQSNCAVQYVVNIINSSDDRVYPKITTSNTNTTVTLPTGVEFCVTLVAVDSIGRRGPDSVPQCVGKMPKFHAHHNNLS